MGSFFSAPHQIEDHPVYHGEQNKFDYSSSSKQNICICYGYMGTNYHGLQLNIGYNTIEKELLECLMDSGLVEPDCYLHLSKINWNEASKTDAGVHAAAQILTFDAYIPQGISIPDLSFLLREKLPQSSSIRIWAIIPSPKTFRARQRAESRIYHYLMPISCFGPTYDLEYLRQKICPLFHGTHFFHNYTTQEVAAEGMIKHTITQFTFSDKFTVQYSGSNEACVLWNIQGPSFLMNQIRKMIAMVIYVSYNKLQEQDVINSFDKEKRLHFGKFPALGLYLYKVEYPTFIAKMKRENKEEHFFLKRDVEFSKERPKITSWINETLYPHIIEEDRTRHVFANWIEKAVHQYPPYFQ